MAYLGRRGALAPVSTADIPDNSITSAKIVDGAVAVADLGPDSVDSAELVDGSIDTSHIGDDQVTGAKIENNPTIAGNLTVSGDLVPATPLSHRNLIINGAMQVWQRANAATATGSGGLKTVDRWRMSEEGDGEYTSERHTMSLAELNTTGHSRALKLVCTTTDASIASTHHSSFWQAIEGQNLQQLQYGTANAKDITLSFWVKSNKTGTYSVVIKKVDSTTYYLPIEYTISSADTWEQKKITITPTAGSTSLITSAAGVINNDFGEAMQVRFNLTWGSNYHGTNNTWTASAHYSTSNQVNWLDSTSNNFYITGVQLELGSNATPFEHKKWQDVVWDCQRYFVIHPQNGQSIPFPGLQNGSTHYIATITLPRPMRTTPTLTVSNNNATMLRHDGYQSMASGVTFGPNYGSSTGIDSDANAPCQITIGGSGLSGGSDMHVGGVYSGSTNFAWESEI